VTSIEYTSDPRYQPGACNIGPAEIRVRRATGIVGVAAAIALGAILVAVGAPSTLRWLVVLPLAGGLISLGQAYLRFCVAFGLRGVRNFGPLGQVERVEPEALSGDRRRALVILASMSGLAIVLTALFVILPV
jgi:uncharacterized membrane protein YdfJ with MMPL/SSD domain